MSAWLLLIGAILSEVTATLSLRGALDHSALYVVVVAGYALSFGFLALVLRRGMGLGVAYGIWAACGVVLTAILSALLFGEAFTVLKASGIVLIAAGVAVVEIGSHRARGTVDARSDGSDGSVAADAPHAPDALGAAEPARRREDA
ncbi:DMT family transporter [Brachybacterium tyrofermentans]|uniref:Multidrug efflux SMR transporter n=1 Tax=Brachybacterium tyrofermentans TaxID=47848 RepID=A0ABW0FFL8_9MICO